MNLIFLTVQLYFLVLVILLLLSVTYEFGKYVYINRAPQVGLIRNFFNHLQYLLTGTLNLQRVKFFAFLSLLIACLLIAIISFL